MKSLSCMCVISGFDFSMSNECNLAMYVTIEIILRFGGEFSFSCIGILKVVLRFSNEFSIMGCLVNLVEC